MANNCSFPRGQYQFFIERQRSSVVCRTVYQQPEEQYACMADTSFIALSIVFTMLPEAPLLSVTGSLFPSSFSSGLVPALSLIVVVSSLSYGIACGKLKTLSEIYNSISSGLMFCSKLFPMYILLVQLFYIIVYVFNLRTSVM